MSVVPKVGGREKGIPVADINWFFYRSKRLALQLLRIGLDLHQLYIIHRLMTAMGVGADWLFLVFQEKTPREWSAGRRKLPVCVKMWNIWCFNSFLCPFFLSAPPSQNVLLFERTSAVLPVDTGTIMGLFPDMVTVYIAIDECRKDNGCLQVLFLSAFNKQDLRRVKRTL